MRDASWSSGLGHIAEEPVLGAILAPRRAGKARQHRSFATYTSTLMPEALEDLLRPEDFIVESALQRYSQLW